MRSKLVAGVLLASVFVVAACGASSEPNSPDNGQTPSAGILQVHGQVVEVSAESLTILESLTIQDGDGRTLSFTARGFAGFTPSHLRDHRALGQPVTVSYEKTSDGLVVVSITD